MTVTTPAKPFVQMDSRKFLSILNDSAQSRISQFESKIAGLGHQAGQNWRLAGLRSKDLFIEDVDNHQFYIAEHSSSHGVVNIANIRQVEIVESEKQNLFADSCLKLVDAIEENDQKGMRTAFTRMQHQRFSGRAVPASGVVRCRDGVSRQLTISDSSIGAAYKNKIVALVVENLKDRVIVENGVVTSAQFNTDKIRLPLTKWVSRKLVARNMRQFASDAYVSEGFQNRIYKLACLVSENKIKAAVKYITPFLNTNEEFTLLTSAQSKTLVENALATKAIFNQRLCDDTATLFHQTNLLINKQKIVSEWRNIAKRSENHTLAENVHVLAESANFQNSYDKFLKAIFETISNREVTAGALATTLEVLRDKTPKIKESHDLYSKLTNIIERLKHPEFDDAAIYEAEDLIATIQEELAANESLNSFDQIPGGEDDMLDMAGQGTETSLGGGGQPIININSPLIQIGGSSAAAADPAAGGLDDLEAPPEEEMDLGPDGDLESLFGGAGGGAAPAAPAPGGQPPAPAPQGGNPFEGKTRKAKAIAESDWLKNKIAEKSGKGKPDELDDAESDSDPYEDETDEVSEGKFLSDYGAPVIEDTADVAKIVRIIRRTAEQHNLSGKKLQENIERIVASAIKSIGLVIPEAKLKNAIDQVVAVYVESEKPWESKPEKKPAKPEALSDINDEVEDIDSVEEDQIHSPKIAGRGFKKAQINISDSIIWSTKERDSILGEMRGVRFVLDHGSSSDLPPVILSEDATVEIPIPSELVSSRSVATRVAGTVASDVGIRRRCYF